MGEIKLWQASFNGGEATPLLEAREDLQKYPNTCRRLRNFHGIIQGPARRRSGSRRIAAVKSNGEAWLLPFIKGRRVAYQIELGNNYARFYANRGQIESSPGVPYEIVTPWSYADLTDDDGTFKFRVVQSNDVIFVCGGTGIKQINRFSDTNWTITDFETVGGPFDGPNISDAAVYASAQTGTVTLSSTHDIFTSDRLNSLMLLRPQNLSSVKPWEPNTIVSTNGLRRSDGKTYKQITAGVTEATNGQVHAGTVSPIHEEGVASDGGTGGKIQDTNQTTASRVLTGYDWEFQDPGYGIVKLVGPIGAGGHDEFTRFLLHLDGADASTTITDATGFSTWTAVGNAQLDTAQAKFGATSALFDGTGDYLTSSTGGMELDSNDFTIDLQFRANHAGSGALRGMIAKMTNFTAATHSFALMINGANQVELSISNGSVRTILPSVSTFNNATNVGWHHLEVSRRGNVIYLFIDGVQENSTAFTGTVPTLSEAYIIGANTEAGDFFTGWIDEVRLTIHKARHTAGFTPPVAAYAHPSVTAVVQPWRVGANAQLPAAVVGAPNNSKRWAWGLFSNANGWPKAPTFFRERFVLATSRKVAFSVPSAYNEFVMETAGTILPDNAFVADIQSDKDEELQWLMPASVLHVGTTGAEHVIQEMTTQQVFGPENRKIDPHTGYGSNGVAPIRVGDTPLFVDASGLRVRAVELGENGRFTALSQNDLAEHITASTVIQTAFAALPDSLYWGARLDGRLACLTFSREQDVFGWSLHTIGGYRDASRLQAARVRSISVIPSPDGTLDDTWMIVERYVNGSIQRQVEFFTEALAAPQQWENEPLEAFKRRMLDFQADQFFVDGGVSLDEPIEIEGITIDGGGVVTIEITGHGLSNGDNIRIDEIMGTWQLNARSFVVANATANDFELEGVDGSEFTAYASGGVVRELVTTVTNLSPYEGQTVQVLTDGAVHPERVVTSGEIELQYPAGRVHIGYGYKSLIETQRPSGGEEAGSAQGQLGAINHIIVRMLNSLGGKIGANEDSLDDIEYRTANDLMDLPPPLFSGDKEQGWPDGFSTDRTVVFVQNQPLPSIIEGFGLNMEVNG